MARGSAGRSSLSRAMQLLSVFEIDAVFLTVSELSERSGLPLATTHRLIGELVEHGLLERDHNKSYRLGVRLWELASKTPGAVGLREIAKPYLSAVHARVKQHAQMGVLSGQEVVFVERLSSPQAVVNYTMIGGRLPLHASSSGLVLLANAEPDFQERMICSDHQVYTSETVNDPGQLRRLLHSVRREGYCVGSGYIHPDARGIAVPVRGPKEEVVATMGVVVPNDNSPTAPYINLLTAASHAVSKDLIAAYSADRAEHTDVLSSFRMLVRSSESSIAAMPSVPRLTAEPLIPRSRKKDSGSP
ncbi:IclR family transcriptional regulator [Glutamicibacter sp. MNS18]|uniref:IclR family transcriptional regulator n=1 Tax=Glutamicibacter sp. MNS18 TaxID=2989817 RepID=UPI003531D770